MRTVKEFLRDIASQLIFDFGRGENANHSGEKGSIGETAAKKRLAEALPGFINVGSGFVLDSFDSISKQTDLIIYENICPSFTLGTDHEYRYYPCEGVCAVGEVKTKLEKSELEDAYEKIASVKRLKRNPARNSFRKFGSNQAIVANHTNALDPNNPRYQIFGFVLCRELKFKPDTLIDHIKRLDSEYSYNLLPSIIVSLKEGIFIRAKKDGQSISMVLDPRDANCIIQSDLRVDSFPFLIEQLTTHIQEATTTCESPIKLYLGHFDSMPITYGKEIS